MLRSTRHNWVTLLVFKPADHIRVTSTNNIYNHSYISKQVLKYSVHTQRDVLEVIIVCLHACMNTYESVHGTTRQQALVRESPGVVKRSFAMALWKPWRCSVQTCKFQMYNFWTDPGVYNCGPKELKPLQKSNYTANKQYHQFKMRESAGVLSRTLAKVKLQHYMY